MDESVEQTYYQRNRNVILNSAKDYYENDKKRSREQAKDKYRNLSEETWKKTDTIICLRERSKD